jgi:hypothetical protein
MPYARRHYWLMMPFRHAITLSFSPLILFSIIAIDAIAIIDTPDILIAISHY